MEILSFPLVFLQMHSTKINKFHLNPKGPSTLDSLWSLSLLLKERQIKITRSDMSKENKGSIALAIERCELSTTLSSTHKAAQFGFGIKFQAAFVLSGIHILVSARLEFWLCCQSSLWFVLTSPTFLSKREIKFPLHIPDSSASWYSWRAYMNSFHSFKGFKFLNGPVRFWCITDYSMSSNYLLTDSNHCLFVLLNDSEDFRRLRNCHSFCSSL